MQTLKTVLLDESDLREKVRFNHNKSEIGVNDFAPDIIDIILMSDLVVFNGRETRVLKSRYGRVGRVVIEE